MISWERVHLLLFSIKFHQFTGCRSSCELQHHVVLRFKLQHETHRKFILIWKVLLQPCPTPKTYTQYTCNLEVSRPAVSQYTCQSSKCPSLCVGSYLDVLRAQMLVERESWPSKYVQDTVASYRSSEQGSRGCLHWLVCPVWHVSTPLTVRHQAIWPSRIFFKSQTSSYQENDLMFSEYESVLKERYVIRAKRMSSSLRPLLHSHVPLCFCLSSTKVLITFTDNLSILPFPWIHISLLFSD